MGCMVQGVDTNERLVYVTVGLVGRKMTCLLATRVSNFAHSGLLDYVCQSGLDLSGQGMLDRRKTLH